jgi:hypothetical protein
MRTKWKLRTIVFMLAAILVTGATARADDSKVFKFGAILAMSGSGSWYGMTMERGMNIAVNIRSMPTEALTVTISNM